MVALLILALVGFVAQLVDGSLGMGYGLTSSTLLVAVGVAPALASASVHLAEIGTTAVSGFSHWRMGNVDKKTVARIAIPGAIGAFVGATVLSNLSTEAAKPWMSSILLVLGLYLIIRFTFGKKLNRRPGTPGLKALLPLGLVGGFVDATGGGGWGPVTTPTLLADGRLAPNKVIGSMNAAEFLVSLAASIGFLLALGTSKLDLRIVAALLIGGVIAAPIAAWMVRHAAPRVLGALVGGMIIFTNTRTILLALGVPGQVLAAVLLLIVAVWVFAVYWAVRTLRAERETHTEDAFGVSEAEHEGAEHEVAPGTAGERPAAVLTVTDEAQPATVGPVPGRAP